MHSSFTQDDKSIQLLSICRGHSLLIPTECHRYLKEKKAKWSMRIDLAKVWVRMEEVVDLRLKDEDAAAKSGFAGSLDPTTDISI